LGESSGYDALAAGNIWQFRTGERYREEGWDPQLGWGHSQPDIVLPIGNGRPPIVISAKSFYLVKSNQRYGLDGRHSHASTRTIYRREVAAEINYALTNGAYVLVLTVINQRNGVAEHAMIDPRAFQSYTTSQRLNDDSWDKELVILDFEWVVWLEANKQLGWERVCNPHFDSEGRQTDYVEPG